jgi:hypothetical protein
VMKFLPAYHNYRMLKELIRSKTSKHRYALNHQPNCICKGISFVSASVANTSSRVRNTSNPVETASLSAQNLQTTPRHSVSEHV